MQTVFEHYHSSTTCHVLQTTVWVGEKSRDVFHGGSRGMTATMLYWEKPILIFRAILSAAFYRPYSKEDSFTRSLRKEHLHRRTNYGDQHAARESTIVWRSLSIGATLLKCWHDESDLWRGNIESIHMIINVRTQAPREESEKIRGKHKQELRSYIEYILDYWSRSVSKAFREHPSDRHC